MKVTTTLASATTPDGEMLVLQEHDGNYFMRVRGVPLMSTIASSSEQTMAELACQGLGKGARVLIGGLGFGFTLRRVLEVCPDCESVDVAELLQVVVDWNREHLGGVNGRLLDDSRVTIRLEDVAGVIAAEGAAYDAVLLDVDNSPDPLVQSDNAGLYARDGVGRVRDVLTKGGKVVYWSANQDKGFLKTLRAVFGNGEAVAAKAYPKAKRCTHTLFVAVK